MTEALEDDTLTWLLKLAALFRLEVPMIELDEEPVATGAGCDEEPEPQAVTTEANIAVPKNFSALLSLKMFINVFSFELANHQSIETNFVQCILQNEEQVIDDEPIVKIKNIKNLKNFKDSD